MKKIAVFIAVLFFGIAFTNVSAFETTENPDFSGTWTLDKEKSSGLPPGISQVMNVKQKENVVEIETIISGEQGKQTVPDKYTVNGAETEMKLPNGIRKRLSKWNAAGNGMDVTEKSVVETPQGKAEIEGVRKWTLSADGKILTIELNFKGPQGEQKSLRTFVKS